MDLVAYCRPEASEPFWNLEARIAGPDCLSNSDALCVDSSCTSSAVRVSPNSHLDPGEDPTAREKIGRKPERLLVFTAESSFQGFLDHCLLA